MKQITLVNAVNKILEVSGEEAIDALPTDFYTANKIIDALEWYKSDTLANEYTFNTDYDYDFTIDTNGEVILPSNCISFQAPSYTVRGGKVFNTNTKTTNIGPAGYNLRVSKIIWDLEWDELPFQAQNYIVIRTARKFQKLNAGSVQSHQFTEEDEQAAYLLLEQFNVNDTAQEFHKSLNSQYRDFILN